MADLLFSLAQVAFHTTKFDTCYREHTAFAANTELFFNNPPLQITRERNSLVLLGSAAPAAKTTDAYLENLLENFSEERIARVKMELPGQWILAVNHDGILYIFSDFLQIRPLYYALEEQLVCSSFRPLHDTLGGESDNYKCFEYLAMRHCLYPAWLGNTTLNRRIRTLRGFEYIKINPTGNEFEIKELIFDLDNSKATSCDKVAGLLRNAVEGIVASPEYRGYPAHTTITGGFDSRLISTLVRKHYPDTRLRIGVFGEAQTSDLRIATRIARVWKTPLDIYKTDKQIQKETFFQMTDYLTPLENAVITELVLSADVHRIGFGGVMGTEILMSLPFESIEALIAGYMARARSNFEPSEEYLTRFKTALREEFSTIGTHYRLQNPETEEKDRIRLFMTNVTSQFCAPQVAAYDICGRQLEPLATYPTLAAALRIPYLLMGGKGTFGGFYLIPKTIMGTLNRRISLIDSTHFSPMYPFGPRTFFAYVFGKFRMRKHIAAKRQAQHSEPKSLIIETPHWSYRSTEWAEGFVNRYFPQYGK